MVVEGNKLLNSLYSTAEKHSLVPVEYIADAARESMNEMKSKLTAQNKWYEQLIEEAKEKVANLEFHYRQELSTLHKTRDEQVGDSGCLLSRSEVIKLNEPKLSDIKYYQSKVFSVFILTD